MRDRPTGLYTSVLGRHRLDARACLAAILPDVVEKCAQAAWLSCWQEAGNNDFYRGHRIGCKEQAGRSADAIRSLSPKVDQRSCTCHPNDKPPQPCPQKYAYGECVAASLNGRIQARWDELRRAGKHGYYETLFQICREQRKESAGEASEICRLLLEAEDILNDLPDDSDTAFANRKIAEAIKLARDIRSLLNKEDNANG